MRSPAGEEWHTNTRQAEQLNLKDTIEVRQ